MKRILDQTDVINAKICENTRNKRLLELLHVETSLHILIKFGKKTANIHDNNPGYF